MKEGKEEAEDGQNAEEGAKGESSDYATRPRLRNNRKKPPHHFIAHTYLLLPISLLQFISVVLLSFFFTSQSKLVHNEKLKKS